MGDEKLERIVEGRMKLKARFEAKMRATPSIADGKPKGSGELNRHGMPKLPVGQTLSKKWLVLDLGVPPHVTKETFRLVVDGAVENPYEVDFAGLLALPQVQDESDFHCGFRAEPNRWMQVTAPLEPPEIPAAAARRR